MSEENSIPANPMDWNSPELKELVEAEGLYVDCGANAGETTAVLSSAGGTVYAFEPNPYAFAALSERFAKKQNIKLIPKAVADSDGVRKLYLHEQHGEDPLHYSSGSSLKEDKVNVTGDFIEVDCVRLSCFLRKLCEESGKQVKILKLDVEGMEYEILQDLLETNTLGLASLILVETHEKKVPSTREKGQLVKRLIEEAGYSNIKYDWA